MAITTYIANHKGGVGRPLIEYRPNNKRSIEYQELGKEILQWLRQ